MCWCGDLLVVWQWCDSCGCDSDGLVVFKKLIYGRMIK